MSDQQKIVPEDNVSENAKVVPVSESIKYRKRAQSAEKQLSELEKSLGKITEENKKLRCMLDDITTENKLSKALEQAGAVDIETAMVLIKQRMNNTPEKEPFEIVEQIKKEKGFLFNLNSQKPSLAATVNRPVKCKVTCSNEYLKKQAQQAAQTGSRKDIMDYLMAKRKSKN